MGCTIKAQAFSFVSIKSGSLLPKSIVNLKKASQIWFIKLRGSPWQIQVSYQAHLIMTYVSNIWQKIGCA
jgi:hypothetical protein